jgi:hypothetical protein
MRIEGQLGCPMKHKHGAAGFGCGWHLENATYRTPWQQERHLAWMHGAVENSSLELCNPG